MSLPTPPRGSTLLETIVVLVIVALVFGMAVPALSSLRTRPQVRTSADSARDLAVTAGHPIRIADDSGATVLALPDGRVLRAGHRDAR